MIRLDRILTFKRREICLENISRETDSDSSQFDCLVSESTLLEEEEIDKEQTWPLQSDSELHVTFADLSDTEADVINAFIIANRNSFARTYHELGCSLIGLHEIRTIDSLPIFLHPYRKSWSEREALKLEVKRMLDAGIIRPS